MFVCVCEKFVCHSSAGPPLEIVETTCDDVGLICIRCHNKPHMDISQKSTRDASNFEHYHIMTSHNLSLYQNVSLDCGKWKEYHF